MGCVFRDRGNSPKALQYFQKAIELAEAEEQYHNYAVIASIYAQMGYVFYRQCLPARAMQAWRNSQTNALQAKDTVLYLQCMEQCGYSYFAMNKMDSAVYVAKKVYDGYRQIHKPDIAASSLGMLILYYMKNDSLDNAKRFIDEYIRSSGMFGRDGKLKKGHEFFYYYQGEYYERTGCTDSAEYFYRSLLENATHDNSVENAYRGLMRVYSKTGDADSVVKYANLFADANDSNSIRNSASEVNRMQALFNYTESQEQAVQEMRKAALYRYLLICSLIFAVVVSICIYGLLSKYHKKQRSKMQAINGQYTDTLLQYTKALGEKDKLESDIGKFREEKEHEIEHLKIVLSAYSGNNNMCGWNTEQSLLEHELVVRIHRHASKGERPSGSELKSLTDLVAELMPDFYNALKNNSKGLSEKEILVCILTRLHFIPSEIAVLLDLTKQRISNMRSALNKKMFRAIGTKSFTANIYRM